MNRREAIRMFSMGAAAFAFLPAIDFETLPKLPHPPVDANAIDAAGFGASRITGLLPPTPYPDAATKEYVDSQLYGGLQFVEERPLWPCVNDCYWTGDGFELWTGDRWLPMGTYRYQTMTTAAFLGGGA